MNAKYQEAIRDDANFVEPKHRIILVEDEEMIRGTITRYLRKQGYEVWSVTNGFEALLLLQYHKPHLVISDIRMPKLGGLTMLEGMRNRVETKNIPIIFITAYREEGYFNRAKELGAHYILLKPFTLSEILEKVRVVIKQHDQKIKQADNMKSEEQSSERF